jgi:hypothetical protein
MLFKPGGLPPRLGFLLTGTQFAGQPGETPPAILPDPAQLEKHGGVGSPLGIGQQAFKLLQALLPAESSPLLLAQLVGQTGPVTLQAAEFALQLGAVPEKLKEPLVLGRLSTHEQLLGNGGHSTLQT